ncbi:hypothetical protein J7T55_005072 [Diaporthe amygdali]|uniref:uncharacterized protein n=1 Tax=Phomopsis amygdali TaxID=1214568 RepID=UPI0022FDB9E3|nr:uncharacterized protein J7T55_005072 [Diaporthe amygdali]KAJ0116126.1 hypothetical protein J7T55_005072 [Diaporthe amygdali]
MRILPLFLFFLAILSTDATSTDLVQSSHDTCSTTAAPPSEISSDGTIASPIVSTVTNESTAAVSGAVPPALSPSCTSSPERSTSSSTCTGSSVGLSPDSTITSSTGPTSASSSLTLISDRSSSCATTSGVNTSVSQPASGTGSSGSSISDSTSASGTTLSLMVTTTRFSLEYSQRYSSVLALLGLGICPIKPGIKFTNSQLPNASHFGNSDIGATRFIDNSLVFHISACFLISSSISTASAQSDMSSSTSATSLTMSASSSSMLASSSVTPPQGAKFAGFPMANITITIDGTKYYPPLPGQDPMIIILSDSTTAKLTDQAIERDDVSLPIPSYQYLSQNGGSSSQQLSSWSVQFSTRQFQLSPCSWGVFVCFQQAEAAFTSAASSIGDSLASLGANIMQAGIADAAAAAGYASEAGSYGVSASSLIDGMSSALSSLEGAAEELDGAMQAINEDLASFTSIELDELTAAGRVFSSYPEISVARGMLSNLSNIIKIAWANSEAVVQSLWGLCQTQWLPITSGGALVTSVWGLHQISQGNSTEEIPQEERLHFILFEKGFSINVFNVWTFVLDQNKGVKTAADPSVNDDLKRRGLPPAYGPGYTTEITLLKATLIRLIPFVRDVYLHPTFEQMEMWAPLFDAMEERHTESGSQRLASHEALTVYQKREFRESEASMNLAAFSHRKGMPPDFTYKRDSSGGQGVTIFIPDSGAAIDGPLWQAEMHNPEWYVVSNRLTLANVPARYHAAEDMSDLEAHGTDMACLAGGETFSLAPNSHLYLIKTRNYWLSRKGGVAHWELKRENPDALHDAYFHIVDIVEERQLQGKAVISNSNGECFSYHYPRYIKDSSTWETLARRQAGPYLTPEQLAEFISGLIAWVNVMNKVYSDIAQAAKSNGIIWIQSSGNQGFYPEEAADPRIVPGVMVGAGDTMPKFGSTRDSEMITVSAAFEDGTFWPVQDGWILFRPRHTSGAAALVAGLTAYFLGLPENADRFEWSEARNQQLPWGVRMKQYMTALSYQWTDGIGGTIQPQYLGRLPFNLPSIVNMAYNGAFGPMNSK